MSQADGINIERKIYDGDASVTLISISGYVDQANSHIMQESIDKCIAENAYNVIFDLENLVYMSSAGWGVLIGEIKRFRENGGDLKLCNMGPEIYEIYQMLEFYHIVSEYPTIIEAYKAFVPGKPSVEAEIDKARQTPVAGERNKRAGSEEPVSKAGRTTADAEKVKETTAAGMVRETKKQPRPSRQKVAQADEKPSPEEEVQPPQGEPGVQPDLPEKGGEPQVQADPEDVTRVFNLEAVKKHRDTPEATEPENGILEDSDLDIASLDDDEEEGLESGLSDEKTVVGDALHKGEADRSSPAKNEDLSLSDVVIEEEFNVNMDEILSDEGIALSVPTSERKSDYVEFNPNRYDREHKVKVLPVPDKVRFVIARHPEFTPRQIRKMLRHPDLGGVKIGFFEMRRLLKQLELDTKEKRFRFYRSA